MNFSNKSKKNNLLFFLAVILIIFGNTVLMAKALDWYQWRGPNRDGISTEKGWSYNWGKEGPKILWKTSVGVGYSSVSVSDGKVYAMGNSNAKDTVYCFDTETGKVIWKYSYPCEARGGDYPGTASTPTIDGKMIYTLSRDGDLYCFDSNTGKVIWTKSVKKDYGSKSPDWEFTSSPLVIGNMLIVNTDMTIAINKTNGNVIWKTKSYGGGYSSPIAFDFGKSKFLAIFNTLGLVILKPDNGQEVTYAEWKTSYDVNATTPIISDDKIFISSGYNVGGGVFQFDGSKLVSVWKNKNMRNHFNSSVLWQGYLYGFDEEQLRCVDFQNGSVRWTQKGLGKGSLMIADGKLIIMSDNGDLVIAEATPAGFKELSRAKVLDGLCWTVPVLSGGKIYCRNHEGDLVCLDVKG